MKEGAVNSTPPKRPVGRPLGHSFEEVSVLAEKWKENGDRTITGLALGLGFASRKQLLEYERRAEFRSLLSECRLLVENHYERSLLEGRHAAGPIFALKNMGWSDRTTLDLGATAEVSFFESLMSNEPERIDMTEPEALSLPDGGSEEGSLIENADFRQESA